MGGDSSWIYIFSNNYGKIYFSIKYHPVAILTSKDQKKWGDVWDSYGMGSLKYMMSS